jgi:hypothetical protein
VFKLAKTFTMFLLVGKNMVGSYLGAKGFFLKMHQTHVISMFIYNFVFWILSLTLHVKCKYVFMKKLFYIIYIIHYALYHITMNPFC